MLPLKAIRWLVTIAASVKVPVAPLVNLTSLLEGSSVVQVISKPPFLVVILDATFVMTGAAVSPPAAVDQVAGHAAVRAAFSM